VNARSNQDGPVVLVVEEDDSLRGVISSLLRSVGLRIETWLEFQNFTFHTRGDVLIVRKAESVLPVEATGVIAVFPSFPAHLSRDEPWPPDHAPSRTLVWLPTSGEACPPWGH
jgi:hypothetical protein